MDLESLSFTAISTSTNHNSLSKTGRDLLDAFFLCWSRGTLLWKLGFLKIKNGCHCQSKAGGTFGSVHYVKGYTVFQKIK